MKPSLYSVKAIVLDGVEIKRPAVKTAKDNLTRTIKRANANGMHPVDIIRVKGDARSLVSLLRENHSDYYEKIKSGENK